MRYQRPARGVNDRQVLAAADRLVADLEAQKILLHPKLEKYGRLSAANDSGRVWKLS